MSIYQCQYFIKLVLLSFVVCYTNRSFAQNENIAIDKKEILIGEQIQWTFEKQKENRNDNIVFYIPDTTVHFDILFKQNKDTINSNGQLVFLQKITFTSFDSGTWYFPKIAYSINDKKYFTDSIKVDVGYMAVDSTKVPRDIKTVIDVPYFNWLWVYIAIGIVVIAILISLLIRHLNKKKISAKTNLKNAYKIAMQSLENLASNNQNLSLKDFHTEIAIIFKTYCGSINHQNYLIKTSDEILQKLKTYQLNAETSNQTSDALLTGDATKFAKYHPSQDENKQAISFIKNAITQIENSNNKTA